MKIIGQPADYSEMLQRIFYFTVASGLFCSSMLAKASPVFKTFFESNKTNADIGPIKGIKLLYILIPFIVALFSRMFRLHDKISDILRIRHFFDLNYILFPLVRGSEVNLNKKLKKFIVCNRAKEMYPAFYKYASFKKPVIDEQLVRNAADDWGWFWVLLESIFLLFVTTFMFLYLKKWSYSLIFSLIILIESLLLVLMWFSCKKNASRQVYMILSDSERKAEIAAHFQSLLS